MNDLSDSFVKAKLLDDIQAEILKKETSMGINSCQLHETRNAMGYL
jgi:hypothetical protein